MNLCFGWSFLWDCPVLWSFNDIYCYSRISINAASLESSVYRSHWPILSYLIFNALHTIHQPLPLKFIYSLSPNRNVNSEAHRSFFCLIHCCIPSDYNHARWMAEWTKNPTQAPPTSRSWQQCCSVVSFWNSMFSCICIIMCPWTDTKERICTIWGNEQWV